MIIPTLNFHGQCSEAMEFYESIFRTRDKVVLTYSGMPGVSEKVKNLIFSAKMELEGFLVWFKDSTEKVTEGTAVTITVTYPTAGKVTEVFNKLLEGGSTLVELSSKPFSQMHGCVKDKFGICWQIMTQ